ncbi:DUF3626 domain-containing protein [Kribbella swartbergensis]
MLEYVGVQFHPDWPFGDGLVIEAIVRDGVYRSQFETSISNGGLTAFPGGDRWRWESRLFDGRYDSALPAERPIYGALDRGRYAHGPAIRFGSAFLRLRREVTARSTFCFPDSVFEPELVVGPDRLSDVTALADAAEHDDLDDYIEAHVHGGVRLVEDVEAIVLDPCFRDTAVELEARSTGCAVEWHPGFRLSTADLDPTYRGPEYVGLARSLGDDLTPALIGSAARSGLHDLQSLKRVWHLLAHFGRAV